MELLIQEGESQQAVLLEKAGFCARGNAAVYLLDIQEQAGWGSTEVAPNCQGLR